MSTLTKQLRMIRSDPSETTVRAAQVINAAISRIEELEGRLLPGPLPTHSVVSTPVDPREDCSLTPWCVRT